MGVSGKNKKKKWETLRTIFLAILVAVFVRTTLFESFNIPSGSMIPTLQIGDYLWVSKYSYGYSRFSLPFSPNLFSGRIFFTEPQRGDVAVFRFTKDTSVDYIKRIIGLPGDRIQVRKGLLYINGEGVPRQLLGPYTAFDEQHHSMPGLLYSETLPGRGKTSVSVTHDILRLMEDGEQNDTPEYTVPEGYFFAMGDNRDNSADSRFMGSGPQDLGFVPMENLIGKAQRIFFSVDSRYPFWQFWHWPSEVRWNRILQEVK
ncbi:signal peptidase I [Entomobacter blattae]|uniref:Signal peptidase I n=1 Tax=Entomobacter blattae TaxID=2762277 RepID=A0A7H1NSK2_9PROT|nr:signal peptidase I [Entomobacter blattae]QNT78762.1 Signal peptidase I [Entomobacter blattae]